MKKIFSSVALLFFVACQKNPTLIQDHQKTNILTNTKWSGYYQYLLGENASNHNNYGDAVEYFEKADELNDALSIDYRIAVEHARHFNFETSLEIIKKMLEKNPDHFYAKLLRAKVYATEGNYIDSKQDFDDILAHPQMNLHPHEKVRTQLSLVALQIEAKDFVAAKKLLLTMQQEDPRNELAYYYLARVHAEEGNLKKAQELFEKTVEINESFTLAYRALILMYEYHDQPAKKIATLEKIIRVQPADIHTRTQLIRLYVEQGNLTQAKKHEEYFANRFEQNVSFCYELGLFYVQQKMFISASQVFDRCLVLYPQDNQIKYYHALSLFYVQKKKKSLEAFATINSESEFYEKSILAQASILRDLQTDDEIVAVFERGINAKPMSSEIRLHYARYQFEKKKYEEAKEILRKAIRRFDKEESLGLFLAEIYEKEKSYKEMEKVLQDILDYNPSSASALNFLGYSYADRGIRLNEAETMILKALEIKPSDGYIQDSLAWVYYKQGKFEKALKVMEVALQVVPNQWILWDHYGDILIKVGRTKHAINAFKKAISLAKEDHDKKKIQKKINLHHSH